MKFDDAADHEADADAEQDYVQHDHHQPGGEFLLGRRRVELGESPRRRAQRGALCRGFEFRSGGA